MTDIIFYWLPWVCGKPRNTPIFIIWDVFHNIGVHVQKLYIIDKLYPDRQCILSLQYNWTFCCPVLGSWHCTRAYTETVDPACRPSIPQQWYWHGTVRQGSVRFNLRVKTRQLLAFPILLYIIYLWCTLGWVNFSEFEITVCDSCKMSKKTKWPFLIF